MNIPRLMLVTDGSLETEPTAIDRISSGCQNGLPAVQLREKQMELRKLWELAVMLRQITSGNQTFFSINDRIDLALAVEADGVQLSEKGLSPQISKKLKPSLIVGVSVHNLEMGLRAEQEGADYVICGPIFDTPSKRAFGMPQGLNFLEKMTRTLSIPVLAIGGIAPVKVKSCMEAGAHGVGAITAFMKGDIKTTIQDFLRALVPYN